MQQLNAMYTPRLDPGFEGGKNRYCSNLCVIGYGMIILFLGVKMGIGL